MATKKSATKSGSKKAASGAKKEMRDYVGEINAKLIEAMEAGTVPWARPWKAGSRFACNLLSGHRYGFGNSLWLSLAASMNGWSRNEWVTYKGASEISNAPIEEGDTVARPLKGQSGFVITRPYVINITKDENGNELPPSEHKHFKRFGGMTVFNVEQVRDLKPEYSLAQHEFKPDCTIEAFLAKLPVETVTSQIAAFVPSLDKVLMPDPASFETTDLYYSVLFHELTHWSGGASRLAREQKGRTEDIKAYAFEELIAELGASYLSAYFGMDGHLRHAAYIEGWLTHLKNDKSFFFSAASRAQKAAEYLLQLAVPSLNLDNQGDDREEPTQDIRETLLLKAA